MSKPESKVEEPRRSHWQFSLWSLLVFTTICCVIFASYQLLLPMWPDGWPRWSVVFFSIWTGSVIGHLCFLVWCWIDATRENDAARVNTGRQAIRAALWGSGPFFLWLTFLLALAIAAASPRPGGFQFDGGFMAVWGLTALHFFPAAFVMGLRGAQSLTDGFRFPVYMAWFCGTAAAVVPSLAVAVHLAKLFSRFV